MKATLLLGDCLVRLDGLEEGSVGSMVSDPPYDLTGVSRGGSPRTAGTGPYGRHTLETKVTPRGFMGKSWDGTGIAFSQEFWGRVHRVLRPGGTVKAFGGTRTFHRMAVAMEDAGFENIGLGAWMYASGFPKSLDVSRAIDKQLGAVRVPKRLPFTGNALMRHGGENTRPWMEAATESGYHELPGDEPVTPESALWKGWGTALKPAWEPVLTATKPT